MAQEEMEQGDGNFGQADGDVVICTGCSVMPCCSFLLDNTERPRPFSGNDNEMKRSESGVVEAIIQTMQ